MSPASSSFVADPADRLDVALLVPRADRLGQARRRSPTWIEGQAQLVPGLRAAGRRAGPGTPPRASSRSIKLVERRGRARRSRGPASSASKAGSGPASPGRGSRSVAMLRRGRFVMVVGVSRSRCVAGAKAATASPRCVGSLGVGLGRVGGRGRCPGRVGVEPGPFRPLPGVPAPRLVAVDQDVADLVDRVGHDQQVQVLGRDRPGLELRVRRSSRAGPSSSDES